MADQLPRPGPPAARFGLPQGKGGRGLVGKASGCASTRYARRPRATIPEGKCGESWNTAWSAAMVMSGEQGRRPDGPVEGDVVEAVGELVMSQARPDEAVSAAMERDQQDPVFPVEPDNCPRNCCLSTFP
jgi:hypothetical protein